MVKNGATTVETYEYDAGGRVKTIARNGATLNIGYNVLDQVTAVTNGTSWVTYAHDANGRRTVSTNSAGTVRRLLVAPTPGTGLESPQLIADDTGAVQQGYVYLGDSPILRFATSEAVAYYLEDGMGSVIGIAPSASPTAGNTTTLFYDGFGNSRATNGPAPSIPAGAGGDYRFHGAWFESGSGLYNLRAREYDPRLGRFLSRDPLKGAGKTPESAHPYTYANANPLVYKDPSGMFTLIEINVVQFQQMSLQTLRTVAIQKAKKWGIQKLQELLSDQLLKLLRSFLPDLESLLGPLKAWELGGMWQSVATYAFCSVLHLPRDLYLETGIYDHAGVKPFSGDKFEVGDVAYDGFGCHEWNNGIQALVVDGVRRPDFIFSPDKPSEARAYLVGDFKLRASTIYNAYKRPGGYNIKQWEAIAAYTQRHAYHVVLMMTVFAPESRQQLRGLQLMVEKAALTEHFVMFIFSLQTKRF
jgi:RHS repeat-associated protein